jgi:membrane protease YdiL (CAAX protease family)
VVESVEGSFGSDEVALIGALTLFSGVALVPVGRLLSERLFPQARVHFVRWGFTHALAVTVFFLLASTLTTKIIGSEDVSHALIAGVSAFSLTAAFVLCVAMRTEPKPWSSLGWTDASHARAVALGVCLYVVFLPTIFGAGLVSPWLVERFGGVAQGQEVLLEIGGLKGDALGLALLIAVCLQPFLEELLFRCFLQPLLVQNFRETGGIVLTSFLFAFIHPGWVTFLPIFCLSLVLGVLYLRTRSFAAVAVVHGLHNGLVLALFLGSERWRELSGASGLLGS